MEKLAIVDLGSNSIRMSIFEVYPDKTFRQAGNYRKMIKLSEGMSDDMNLRPDAQLRAVAAFLEFGNILKNEGVTKVETVATAAVRKAKNGAEFVRDVKNVTGFEICVIDGEREAELDCLAIRGSLGIERGIVCDIGGGSAEFIAISGGVMEKPPVSIHMGSRWVTERFFGSGESPEAVKAARAYVRSKVEELPWLDKMKNAPILGIGGTLRAFAKCHMGDSSGKIIDRHQITAKDADRLLDEIMKASIEERSQMPGIGKERCDIILGGLLPFEALKELVQPPLLIVADVGVREGILFERMG